MNNSISNYHVSELKNNSQKSLEKINDVMNELGHTNVSLNDLINTSYSESDKVTFSELSRVIDSGEISEYLQKNNGQLIAIKKYLSYLADKASMDNKLAEIIKFDKKDSD